MYHTYVCMYVYVCMYMYRERERHEADDLRVDATLEQRSLDTLHRLLAKGIQFAATNHSQRQDALTDVSDHSGGDHVRSACKYTVHQGGKNIVLPHCVFDDLDMAEAVEKRDAKATVHVGQNICRPLRCLPDRWLLHSDDHHLDPTRASTPCGAHSALLHVKDLPQAPCHPDVADEAATAHAPGLLDYHTLVLLHNLIKILEHQ
jgi:hypothetical protein